MKLENYNSVLKETYTGLHGYANAILSELKEDIYNWTPTDSKARSIYSYTRHMVNTEIYWLHAIKDHKIPYFGKELKLQDLLEHFGHLEIIYSKLIDKISEDETIVPTIYELDPKTKEISSIKQKGSTSWTVLRISLHAFGHLSQITHILYSQGVQPNHDKNYSWWQVTENMISLAKLG